jgi:hypothetical protein
MNSIQIESGNDQKNCSEWHIEKNWYRLYNNKNLLICLMADWFVISALIYIILNIYDEEFSGADPAHKRITLAQEIH